MMKNLNYKHLRYFWMVAKTGSIVRASEQLYLSPQSISGQLAELEDSLGVQLLRKAGRGLELTETGRRIYSYADEIFALGNELLDVIEDQKIRRPIPFRIGIADCVPKSVAYMVIEPALNVAEPIRLSCREGKLSVLLSDMSIHRLDLVIADRPMPASLNVKAYNHMLGESSLAVFGRPELVNSLSNKEFPKLLDKAPFLMPGEDFAVHLKLNQWFEKRRIFPRIVGEFDDSALLKFFGKAGVGLFVAPSAITDFVCDQYGVIKLGEIEGVTDQLYAITPERRLTHPGVIAVVNASREIYQG
jgi:LysR family transcriptional activator of nhaA